MTTLIGKSVKRGEDKRFLTGKGHYTDDIVLPGMVHAYILRSPFAHARINSVDTSAADHGGDACRYALSNDPIQIATRIRMVT